MIHHLLNLTRPLFVLDTETTGTDTENDRIVEIGFEQWGPEGLVKEWRSLVNPGIRIPPAATAVHGIIDEMVVSCQVCAKQRDACACERFHVAPLFKQLAPSLARGFTDCDFAGKNVRFDLRILAAEMKRAGVEWSYAGARIIDCGRLEQLAVPRDLGSLHEKYTGAKHDGAHGALSDVRASTTVIVKQLEMHATLPRDLDKLHELSWPGWIDTGGKFVFVNGVARFGRWGKFAGRRMDDPEVNRPGRNGQTYWDFILSSDFPPEVKALASEAKMGRFPVQKR